MIGRARAFRSSVAFTLIELLVVVAIIAVLAAMLLPALKNARLEAHKTRGINNLRQAVLATSIYADDHGGVYPNNGIHTDPSVNLLTPYVSSNLLHATKHNQPSPNYYCIVDPDGIATRWVIMCNFNFMGGMAAAQVPQFRHPISDVRRPGTTFLLAHNFAIATSSPIHFDQLLDGSFAGTYSPPYYNKGLAVSFVDNHVEFLPWKGSGQSRWWEVDPVSSWPNCTVWFGCGYTIFNP